MLSDEDIMGLPDHPDEAFVEVERIASSRLEQVLYDYRERGVEKNGWDDEIDYMSDVIAGARHYGIEGVKDWSIPGTREEFWEAYRSFRVTVSSLTKQLRFSNIQRLKQIAIAFDPATKVKLRHLLDQMREAVDKEKNLSPRKKDALFSKIAALSKEIDSDWTRSESYGALAIELAADGDEAVGELKNVRRWLDAIGAVFGKARREQEARARLPAPRDPKRIEPPASISRSKPKPSQFDKKIDDEIPF